MTQQQPLQDSVVDLAWARMYVDEAFSTGKYSHRGVLVRANDDPGRELLKELLFQFNMMDATSKRARLSVYFGLGSIGGDLWTRAARAMVQVSTISHPALSPILDGGHITEFDMAYVVSSAAENTMAEVDMELFAESMAGSPRLRFAVLEQVRLLADALYRLHSRHIFHRNVWPGAVEIVKLPSEEEESLELRLARFEMSELVSNLTRRINPRHPDETLGLIKDLFLFSGPLAFACAPPERVNMLLGGRGDTLDGIFSDVFGLGMMTFLWLVDPRASARIHEAFSKPRVTADDHAELLKWARVRIRESEEHRELKQLLLEMLDTAGRARPTAYEVVERIDHYAKDIARKWGVREDERTYLLSIAQNESTDLKNWGLIESLPTTPEGAIELKEFVERDLASGSMVYSQDGAQPYIYTGDLKTRQAAQYVLIGERAVYFCQPFTRQKSTWFKDRGGDRSTGALHISYCTLGNRRVLGDLHGVAQKQPIPRVELVDKGSPLTEQAALGQRPPWDPHLKIVRNRAATPDQDRVTFKQAIDWLLDVDEARLGMRRYLFERVGGGRGTVVIVHRTKDDEERINKSPTLHLLRTAEGRPSLADFCESLDDDKLVLVGEEAGEKRVQEVEYVGRQSQNAIEIRRRESDLRLPLPERGWLQPADDRWSLIQLQRQREAATELFQDRPDLVSQLLDPRSILRPGSKWEQRNPGAGLQGGADRLLVEMLDTFPFYALQGPPGTGKTTITARGVIAQLREHMGERILVSAQSHFSLDNMAVRILREIKAGGLTGRDGEIEGEAPAGDGRDGDGPGEEETGAAKRRSGELTDAVTALRLISTAAEAKVRASEIRACLPENLAEARVRAIEINCAAILRGGVDEQVDKIVGEWKASAKSLLPEIRDRLRRGANIVFVTCGMATPQQLSSGGQDGLFDWVILEEAAKAWPTELIIPLVRGVRWTLIGDQAQLPAFGRDRIEQLLLVCERSSDPDLARHGAAKEQYLRYFELFARFFAPPRQGAQGEGAAPAKARPPSGMLRRPTGELTMQFRMPRMLGRLVSSLFYPKPGEDPGKGEGRLLHGPSTENVAHALRSPGALKGRNMVWVDTSDLPNAHDERPAWRNEAEARYVRDLVDKMKPRPPQAPRGDGDRQPTDELFAILTPYHQQEERLKLLLPEYSGRIQTVDSFQGKEADVVVVSLVRHNDRETAVERLGYLADDRRANVLLSRARKLLIVVGSFAHFAKAAPAKKDPGGQWPLVCAYFESIKARLRYDELLKDADAEGA